MGISKAVIKINNLAFNFQQIRKKAGRNIKICAAVKGDAYGHGAVEVSKTLVKNGCEYLAVAAVSEAEELRKAGIKAPIMLLSLVLPEEYQQVADLKLSPLVCTKAQIEGYASVSLKNNLKIHLHIDTGMGRIGCAPEEAPELAALIENTKGLVLEGLSTHFPIADDDGKKGMKATHVQTQLFADTVNEIRSMNILPDYIHAANSGAVTGHPDSLFNMVRPGIFLYGYYPSRQQERKMKIKPVMEFRSKIMQIKNLNPGQTVSYGMTWTAKNKTTIAVVAAGYADGVSRLLSNKGTVMVNGRRYPIIGRVTMDQFMIDLGNLSDAELYDDVIIFGDDPKGPSAEEIAEITGTIPYEVLCNVSKRVERIYI